MQSKDFQVRSSHDGPIYQSLSYLQLFGKITRFFTIKLKSFVREVLKQTFTESCYLSLSSSRYQRPWGNDQFSLIKQNWQQKRTRLHTVGIVEFLRLLKGLRS